MFAMSGSRLIIELQTAVIVCSDGSVVVIAGGCRPEIKSFRSPKAISCLQSQGFQLMKPQRSIAINRTICTFLHQFGWNPNEQLAASGSKGQEKSKSTINISLSSIGNFLQNLSVRRGTQIYIGIISVKYNINVTTLRTCF